MEMEVPSTAAGTRIDGYLGASLGSRAQAARAIEEGRVLVDGAAVRKSHVLAGGERVDVEDEAPSAGAAAPTVPAVPFRIAWEDEHLIVVDKPAGLVVHPARGHWEGTLAQALSGRIEGGEDPARAGIVHRLDKDTSGLLVVSRTPAAHRALKAALASRTMRREYLALVEGRPPARSGTIDAPLGRDRRRRTRMSSNTDRPREARTHFVLERPLPGSSLLRVTLETGRTHQIRAHLQSISHPVAGDPEYGTAGRFGLSRQFLHAARLAFPHPVSGEQVDVSSPLPDDLATALHRAEREV
jgi:23S rRNA pseudouridine1911/1915/1917 synthase